jgi:hypothetical protein
MSQLVQTVPKHCWVPMSYYTTFDLGLFYLVWFHLMFATSKWLIQLMFFFFPEFFFDMIKSIF